VTGERLRGVLAPAAELAFVDGMTLVLLSVELWSGGVFLHLAVLRNAATDELDAAHERAFDGWTAGRRDQAPPPMPGTRLGDLALTVADDTGTSYQPSHRAAGGSGTEWRSEWKFEPGAPPEATRLTITLESPGNARPLELVLPTS
jgi:hypothetical protein